MVLRPMVVQAISILGGFLIFVSLLLWIYKTQRLAFRGKLVFLIALSALLLVNVTGLFPFLCEKLAKSFSLFAIAEASSFHVIEERKTFYRCHAFESWFWSDPLMSAVRGADAFAKWVTEGKPAFHIPRGIDYSHFSGTISSACPSGTMAYLRANEVAPTVDITCALGKTSILHTEGEIGTVDITYGSQSVSGVNSFGNSGTGSSPKIIRALYFLNSGKVFSDNGHGGFRDLGNRLIWSNVEVVTKLNGWQSRPHFGDMVFRNLERYLSMTKPISGPNNDGSYCASYEALPPFRGSIDVCVADGKGDTPAKVTGSYEFNENIDRSLEAESAAEPLAGEKFLELGARTVVFELITHAENSSAGYWFFLFQRPSYSDLPRLLLKVDSSKRACIVKIIPPGEPVPELLTGAFECL